MKRIHRAAKFFFDGEDKFFLQGVTYGPFRPGGEGAPPFPEPERVRADFRLMRAAGINLLRLYHTPPPWMPDLAGEFGLRLLTTVPWPLRGLFLNDRATRKVILENMREAAGLFPGHPAVFGFFVDNEMPPDLVRWLGNEPVSRFLDLCALEIKNRDPEALVSYASFPSSEYLQPTETDFCSFNIYLHNRQDFCRYVQRLHHLAGEQPLVISEVGMDSIRNGAEAQADFAAQMISDSFSSGAAGAIWFSWTDEWFTGGEAITDWAFGLVDGERSPKPAYHAIREAFSRHPTTSGVGGPASSFPGVSVIVCTYNGAETLEGCLRALQKQNYPDYEIIVVDDGSTDETRKVLSRFKDLRVRHQDNQGLGVARNEGIRMAENDYVAFTDADCMPDADWLSFLVRAIREEGVGAAGGPNISPPARDWVQATVAAAPGSPSHVLLSDSRAEHVPGCNMIFEKDALAAIGGFDPVYRKAGDDVDVCWKLLDLGYEIAFAPSAVVWHHRRFTTGAYDSQQSGYGEAEALLRFRHPARFDGAGAAIWKGRIYGNRIDETLFTRPAIYFGQYAMGAYQAMYRRPGPIWAGLLTSIPWLGLILLIVILSIGFPVLRVLPVVMIGLTLWAGWMYMVHAQLESRFDGYRSRLLLFYLSLRQPLVRGWARYFTWLRHKRTPKLVELSPQEWPHHRPSWWRCRCLEFWSQDGKSRLELLPGLKEMFEAEGWRFICDNGWSHWDFQIFANQWWHIDLLTQSEYHAAGACLTRVRIRMVTSSFTILFLAAGVGTVLSLSLRFPVLAPVLVGLLAAWFVYVLYRGLRVRRRVAETVLAATAREGFRRLEPNQAEESQ
jgi:GT2 family glycosyltransferase